MSERNGIFAGDDPFALAQAWLDEATAVEPNDPNAIALATVDETGLPNVRMVLLKEIEQSAEGRDGSFIFYTNYESTKSHEIATTGKAAFVMHWKSLRRQLRVRGTVTREDGPLADAYYASRDLESRIGAWASAQSQPLESRAALMARIEDEAQRHGSTPARPPFWGGFRIHPQEIEFWADGAHRLHDRFLWSRDSRISGEKITTNSWSWTVIRLNP